MAPCLMARCRSFVLHFCHHIGSVLEDTVLKRRPLLVTPWSIWIKPRLRGSFRNVRLWTERGMDNAGRICVMIVDNFDRAYWVRLNPRQYKLVCRRDI